MALKITVGNKFCVLCVAAKIQMGKIDSVKRKAGNSVPKYTIQTKRFTLCFFFK